MNAIENATLIGTEHRAAFTYEFGCEPIIGEVGEWDAYGVGEMWREVSRDESATFDECRIAYLKSLFATDDVG